MPRIMGSLPFDRQILGSAEGFANSPRARAKTQPSSPDPSLKFLVSCNEFLTQFLQSFDIGRLYAAATAPTIK